MSKIPEGDVPQWTAVQPQPKYPEHIAPPGTIYVCAACGKTARDILDGPRGWDESCMLNAVLCHDPAGAQP
jgi:hypothetical protein